VPIPEPQKRGSVAPAERVGEAAELLPALLTVPSSEGWQALASAMSDELFDRLKQWHAPRLVKIDRKSRGGTVIASVVLPEHRSVVKAALLHLRTADPCLLRPMAPLICREIVAYSLTRFTTSRE